MFWRALPYALTALAVLASSSLKPRDAEVAKIDAQLIDRGLQAWNKTDQRGRACVTCHSPQGLELAFYGFDDDTIRRRALSHVDAEDAQAIIGMIHARRREYQVYVPKDPMADRPLQPGGHLLPGSTPEERDAAFAQEIDARLPLLTRGSVDSISKAREAAKQILAVDLKSLPVGIAFDRLSEDGFHGPEHAILADWIPDTPVKLPEEAIAARDAYQRDPSEANLNRFIERIPIELPRGAVGDQLALVKYRALLRLQAQLAHPERDEIAPKMKYDNPFWDLGEIARNVQGLPLKQLGWPDDIREKKEPGPPVYQQFRSMKLPWFWEGWISDPSLQHTAINRKSQRGQYFGFSLFDDGPYPMHAAFVFLRKQLSQSFDPKAWTMSSPQHYVLEYTTFLANRRFDTAAPKQPAAEKIYRRFVANAFRTSLYLLLDETNKTHMTDLQTPELGESQQIVAYLDEREPATKRANDALLANIEKAFSTARQMRG